MLHCGVTHCGVLHCGVAHCGVLRCGVLHCELSALFREIIAVYCGNNAEHVPVHNLVDIVRSVQY